MDKNPATFVSLVEACEAEDVVVFDVELSDSELQDVVGGVRVFYDAH